MLKKVVLIAFLSLCSLTVSTSYIAEARSGCCSHHGGVCGCMCCDSTPLSVKCAPYYPKCTEYPNFKSSNLSSDVSEKEVVYVGSVNSNKYHRLSCIWANKIKSKNLIGFKSKKDAKKYEYVPCKVCNP